jgi:hypothetical protein
VSFGDIIRFPFISIVGRAKYNFTFIAYVFDTAKVSNILIVVHYVVHFFYTLLHFIGLTFSVWFSESQYCGLFHSILKYRHKNVNEVYSRPLSTSQINLHNSNISGDFLL